jgi:DNA-binding NtrC family response regulator
VEATASSSSSSSLSRPKLPLAFFYSGPQAPDAEGTMSHRPCILLAETDPSLSEMIRRHLHEALDLRLRHVRSATELTREESERKHDLVLTAMELMDGDGLMLVRRLRVANDCPVVLMIENPKVQDVIDAMRVGVSDVLIKPFDLADLSSTVADLLDVCGKRRREQSRQRRLRRMATEVVRERRELRQRMELICQDIVQAYRKLAQRVSDAELLSPHSLD